MISYLNLIGVRINLLNSFLTILGIIVVSVVILVFRSRKGSEEKTIKLKVRKILRESVIAQSEKPQELRFRQSARIS